MTTNFEEFFASAVGERIEAVRSQPAGGWTIATKSMRVHVAKLRSSTEAPIEHQRIVAAAEGAHARAWSLVLEDNTIVTLDVVDAERCGSTPVEGVPIADPRGGSDGKA